MRAKGDRYGMKFKMEQMKKNEEGCNWNEIEEMKVKIEKTKKWEEKERQEEKKMIKEKKNTIRKRSPLRTYGGTVKTFLIASIHKNVIFEERSNFLMIVATFLLDLHHHRH